MSNELKLVEFDGYPVLLDENGLPWLSQSDLAEWLGLAKGTISEAVKNALETGSPQQASAEMGLEAVRTFRTTADDGKTYNVKHYNFLVVSMIAMRANRTDAAFRFQVWGLKKLAYSLMADVQARNEELTAELSSEANARRTAEMKSQWLETKEQMRTRAIDRRYEDYED